MKTLKGLLDLKDVRGRAIVRKRMDRILLGNLGDNKSVGHGVFEIRINFGPGYRLYFAKDGDLIILLLVGGDKFSQVSDILRVRRYLKDYQDRKGDF